MESSRVGGPLPGAVELMAEHEEEHEATARQVRSQPEEVSFSMETRVGANESIESALKRFKKMCQKSGVLAEARRHEHYEKPSVRRKKKSAAARKRRS